MFQPLALADCYREIAVVFISCPEDGDWRIAIDRDENLAVLQCPGCKRLRVVRILGYGITRALPRWEKTGAALRPSERTFKEECYADSEGYRLCLP